MKFLRTNVLSAVALLAALILTSTNSLAQQGYVTIGSGTGTTGGTSNFASSTSPITPGYRNFRYQVIYTAAEIQAAGGTAGNINRLAWNVASNTTGLTNYTVSLGHTTATNLSSHVLGATQVYTTSTYSPSTGLNDLNFSTPFNWNGTSNILVEVCYSRSSTSSNGGSVYTTSGNSPANRYISNSSSSPTLCTTNTSTTNFSTKPQVRFYMTVPAPTACATPTNLTVTNNTTTTASFSWTNGSPTVGVAYAVTTTNVAPTGSGTTATGTSVTISSGLSAGNSYYFWIRNRCTASSNSEWISIPFSTACNAPSLTTTAGSRCGAGSVTLGASPSAGTTYWWSAASGGTLLGTGNSFNTPSISSTTTYYASAGQATAGNKVAQFGTANNISTIASQSPFHSSSYAGQSTNYLIRASELLSAGISAGYITSLALDVVVAGSTLNNFYIRMANTPMEDLSAGFANTSLSFVYGNNLSGVTYQPVVGTNTFALSNSGFYWDGSSNLSIIIYWQGAAGSTASTIRYSETPTWASTRYQTLIGSSWGTAASVQRRANISINGKGLCMSARQAVTATIETGNYTYYRDADGDGFGDPTNSISSCNTTAPAGYTTDNSDCNDNQVTYQDNDGDGYGNNVIVACGGVSTTGDCDDSNAAVWQSGFFFVDMDGDGYAGSAEDICYGETVPAGYITTPLGHDCNDNNANVHPGASEICGNNIDDDCNGLAEETCPQPSNDNPGNNNPVHNNPAQYYPNCSPMAGTTAGAGINPATGEQDVWYQFDAISTGVSIRVSTSAIDAKIRLFHLSDLSTPLDIEDAVSGIGNEILNFGNLVVGERYRIAVSSVSHTAGSFDICVRKFRMPTASSVTRSLCELLHSSITAANNTIFNFTNEATQVVSSYVSNTYHMPLTATSANLQHGGIYSYQITNKFILPNGAGEIETISVHNPETYTLNIAPHRSVEVKSNNQCANSAVLARNGILYGQYVGPNYMCKVTGFRAEFTPVANCNGDDPQVLETFSKAVAVTNPHINLNYAFNHLPLSQNNAIGYWSVRWKPRFSGYEGEYGPAHVIAVNGTAPAANLTADQGGVSNALSYNGDALSTNIYPNPNNGEIVNLNVTGITTPDVFVRIMDSMGREVYTNRYAVDGSLNTMVSFSKPLAQGVYLIEFTTGNEVKTQRMMVTK
jgi:hypothetical protein